MRFKKFQLNPKYSYSYQVASDEEQTYIKHQEARDNDVVTGQYSYVDPLGSLITVSYSAGPDGYQEERVVEANFIAIRARPDKPVEQAVQEEVKPVVLPTRPAPVRPAPVQEESSEDLIAKIIAQLTPFIKDTVSNSLGSNARASTTSVVRQPAPVAVVRPAPAPVVADAVTNVFGTGGTNNVRVETPNFDFAYDLEK